MTNTPIKEIKECHINIKDLKVFIENELELFDSITRVFYPYPKNFDKKHLVVYNDYTVDSIFGETRAKRLVQTRKIITYMLRSSNATYAHIGRLFNRDHSTIINLEYTFTGYLNALASVKEKQLLQTILDKFKEYEQHRVS